MDPSQLKAGSYNFAQVFAAEADEIAAQCQRRGVEPDLHFEPGEQSPVPDRFGLAFSGGGIRSASVQLGVVQALAKSRMLRQVHYISGISGGGYLLGWLTAWIFRQAPSPTLPTRGSFDRVEDQLASNSATGKVEDAAHIPSVQRHLEPFPIHYLRRYTSYLTPRKGLFSGDLLAAVSIYLRNVLLNMVLVASLALAVMFLLQFPAFLNSMWDWSGIFCRGALVWLVPIAFVAMFIASVGITSYSLHQIVNQDERELGYAGAAVIGSGLLACAALWLFLPAWFVYARAFPTYVTPWILIGLGVIGILLAAPYEFRDRRRARRVHSVERSVWWSLAIRILAWVAAIGAGWLVNIALCRWLSSPAGVQVPHSYAVFGLPALLLGVSLLSYLWVGMMGGSMPDAEREWLARAAGYFLAFAVVTALLFSIAFYGPVAVHLVFTPFENPTWKKYLLSILLPGGWLFTVIAGLIGGQSPSSDGQKKSSGIMDALVSVAPLVFILGVLLLSSWGAHALADRFVLDRIHQTAVKDCLAGQCPTDYLPWADWHVAPPSADAKARANATQPAVPTKQVILDHAYTGNQPQLSSSDELVFRNFGSNPGPGRMTLVYGLCILAVAALAVFFGFRLDVNEFSQHLFYRNRLVRAFLGASHPEMGTGEQKPRKANKFTGFTFDDDVFLRDLTDAHGFEGPYPIWGTCLNLTTGQDLAWQKRKGASFIYSPLFCGWDYVRGLRPPMGAESPECQQDDTGKDTRKLHNYGYRSTRPNKKREEPGYIPGYGGDGGAPLIGTAMAASGAAIAPNWGYHSKPAVAALLTLFNVRLGWWTGNPRHHDTWKAYAPSIFYLLSELTGNATDEGKYVYLSDGGHFENLGIYELIRRRVRFIICSDADADPDFQFQDLGNAVSTCRRDFGVEIKLGAHRTITISKDPYREAHFAVGEIIYPGQKQTGRILFIKSSLTNDEPADVLAMKKDHPDFPHDSTLNQFFDEQMFESYRALGEHIMTWLIEQSGATRIQNASSGANTVAASVRAFYNWLRPQVPAGEPATVATEEASITEAACCLAKTTEELLPSRS